MNWHNLRTALGICLGAGLYFVAAKIGLFWASINANASAIWPATGLALAGLLLFGRRFWPGILLGAFWANWQTSDNLGASAAIAIGNTLEAVAGAWMVGRFANGVGAFESASTILRYVFCAILSTALSATVGATSLSWGGLANAQDCGRIWQTWWLGDLVSDFTVAPALLLWFGQGMPKLERKDFYKAVAMIVSVGLVGEIVLGGWTRYHLSYLCIPFMVWAAYYFYQWGAATAILILSVIAIVGTLHGESPFTASSRNESLLLLQTFMGTVSLTGLVLGALAFERKRLEERLTSVAQFPEENPSPVLRLAASGTVLYANRAAAELLGTLSCQAEQKNALQGAAEEVLREGAPKTFELQGGQRIYSFFCVPVAAKAYINFYGRDITGSKRAEAGMAQATARLEGVISSAMDAIISIDSDQRIILFNGAAEKMFGVSASQALGRPLDEFVPQRYRAAHARHVQNFGETGVSTRQMGVLGQVSGLRHGGEEFPIEASISQTQVGGTRIFTVILRDITERRRAEEAVREAREQLARANEELESKVRERTVKLQDALNELQHFSYTITHDMRAPLRAMQGMGQILLEEAEPHLEPEHRDHLRRIVAASDRLDNLIRDALNYSTLVHQQYDISAIDVESLLREIIESYPGFQAPHVEVEMRGPLPFVLGNKAGLTQCFANLLRNAVKFVKPGHKPKVCIRAEERGDLVRLVFEDNGIGIAPAYQERIFEMFQQLNPACGGTGIGLALVKKAAERMDGKVGVQSQPGQGSQFWLEFKRAGLTADERR